jgi:xanthine dehydrogenase accessory factor
MENIYHTLSIITDSGISAALCTLIESAGSTPRKAGSKMIVYPDKTISGTIGGGKLEHMVIQHAIQCMNDNKTGIFHFNLDADAGMSCGGQTTVFIEPVESKKKLIIFGAGHIGSFLAQQAQQLNFSVTLIDERAELLSPKNIPGIETICLPHAEAIPKLKLDSNTFVCVITHKHDYDKEIIGAMGTNELGFLGMIGSKRKIATISKELLDKHILDTTQLEKINWPLGVDIKCQTPQEIAISVLAKLIDVRNSQN